MKDISKYEQQIESAIKKYAGSLDKQSSDDLYQDIRMSILSHKGKITKKNVTDIARKKIAEFVNKILPKFEDISDPKIISKSDKQNVIYPDIDTKLDAEKAVTLAERLPEPYRYIIIASFGIKDEPILDKDLAIKYKKSVDWVYRTRNIGLLKLRTIMEKNGIS